MNETVPYLLWAVCILINLPFIFHPFNAAVVGYIIGMMFYHTMQRYIAPRFLNR